PARAMWGIVPPLAVFAACAVGMGLFRWLEIVQFALYLTGMVACALIARHAAQKQRGLTAADILVLCFFWLPAQARWVRQWSVLEIVGKAAYIFFFTATIEEFFFRGVLQNLIIRRFSGPRAAWWGIGISSVLFGAVHARKASYALLAAIAGVFYGITYYRSG